MLFDWVSYKIIKKKQRHLPLIPYPPPDKPPSRLPPAPPTPYPSVTGNG